MLRSFFDVTPVELGQLGPEPAVTVLREMLWAEVNNLGIPISDTDIPFAVTTSDGGIDAVVNATPKGSGNGLIFAPRTSYQVKTGGFALSATSLGQIEKLLISPQAITARVKARAEIGGKSHKLENISTRVRECLDCGGTFIAMLFGDDGVDTEEMLPKKRSASSSPTSIRNTPMQKSRCGGSRGFAGCFGTFPL